MLLEELKKQVINCKKCSLSETVNNVVFGEGNRHAPIFIIAEAPGKDEDRQGRPFVGKSGQLLDKILDACGFNRTDHVYISNIIKCRPPNNRTPFSDETNSCMPYLIKQIDLINPSIIIMLGATALKNMFGSHMKITKVRGQWLKYNNRLALPVFHPAALLRNSALKRETWEDFKKIVFKYREIIDSEHYSEHV